MSDDEEDGRNNVGNEVQEDEENWIVDSNKFNNLLTRRKVYGDITQNVSERQIKRLLVSRNQIHKKLKLLMIIYRDKHFIKLINY